MAKSPFKMPGFSGFGNSPLKYDFTKNVGGFKKPTGKNKKVVDTIVNTIVPNSAGEALGFIGGGGIVKNLKNIGSKVYQAAKSSKTIKSIFS